MSEELTVPANNNVTGLSNVEEFYIHRINWLITLGRFDLIDEIADDYERRRAAPNTTADRCPAPEAAMTRATPAAYGPLPDPQNLADDNTANQPGARHNFTHNASAPHRPPYAVHHGRSSQSEPRIAAGLPPKPVETGTRLAVARLRRSRRPGRRSC
jgi:hypothetical protein